MDYIVHPLWETWADLVHPGVNAIKLFPWSLTKVQNKLEQGTLTKREDSVQLRYIKVAL